MDSNVRENVWKETLMNKATRICRWLTMGTLGGMVLSGGCVPESFWADLWANTIITGTVNAILTKVLASFGL
jgi:hypothetical protein